MFAPASPPPTTRRSFESLRPWALSVLLLPACVYFLATRGTYTLMDSADLIIHEAGHVVFGFLGPFVAAAGGTLMQMILPSVLARSFARNAYRPGVQVGLFWLGHNLLNISVYAADARVRRLPLLGGDAASHDWATMLSMTGLLQYDQWIAGAFVAGAVLVFIACLAAPRFM